MSRRAVGRWRMRPAARARLGRAGEASTAAVTVCFETCRAGVEICACARCRLRTAMDPGGEQRPRRRNTGSNRENAKVRLLVGTRLAALLDGSRGDPVALAAVLGHDASCRPQSLTSHLATGPARGLQRPHTTIVIHGHRRLHQEHSLRSGSGSSPLIDHPLYCTPALKSWWGPR